MIVGKASAFSVLSLGLMAASLSAKGAGPELTYLGRSSIKVVTSSGFVIYVDPYAPGDYSQEADLVLVTHGHGDHNQVKLVSRKATCLVASPAGAVSVPGAKTVAEGDSLELASGKVKVRVLPAGNAHHSRSECVGYLISFDGLALYHSGDTDYLPEMESYAKYKIDYALFPCDGFYNMAGAEAARCAVAVGAKRVIPIHSDKDGIYSERNVRAVGESLGPQGPKLLALKPGQKARLGE